MTRLRIHVRVLKKLQALGPDTVAMAEKQFSALQASFGNPHLHTGLGLRKLSPRVYEMHLGRQWRLILVHEQDALLADDLLDHQGVRLWLKHRR